MNITRIWPFTLNIVQNQAIVGRNARVKRPSKTPAKKQYLFGFIPVKAKKTC